MNEQKLCLNWLVDRLQLLKVPGRVLEEANNLTNELKEVSARQLTVNLWEAKEFLALALAFNLVEELCTATKTVGSMYRHERMSGISIRRPLSCKDVDEAIDKAMTYFNEKIVFFENEVQRKFFSNMVTPMAWLEIAEAARVALSVQQFVVTYEASKDDPQLLVENYTSGGWRWLVIADLAIQIRCKAFEISEKEGDETDYFPLAFTLTELAARWATNEKNVIAAVERSDLIWPYLTITDGMHLHERTIPVTTAMIVEGISGGSFRPEYKYGYKGFVRLVKKAFFPNRISLEYFHAKRVIDPAAEESCIWLDSPLCKVVTGKYQFIEVKKKIEPILYFISEEVLIFEKTQFFVKSFPGGGVHDLDKQDNSHVTEASTDSVNRFSKIGQCYEIHYRGQKTTLKSSKGLAYLSALVRKPRNEIHVNQLEAIINKPMLADESLTVEEMESEGLFADGNTAADLIADQVAIDAVYAAIESLTKELKQAKDKGIYELVEKLEDDIEKYQNYLKSAVGKNYKPRKFPDQNERARKRVFSAISDALEAIRQSNLMDLYEHLSRFVKKGQFCVYMPDEDICWK